MPEQRMTMGEAIRAMTLDAAYAVFAEEQLGQLRVGRAADMTVLSGTLSLTAASNQAPPSDLLQRQVLLTVVGGQVVYDGMARTSKPQPQKAPAKAPPPRRATP
jgi:predicted amidohydrolase YtcJ